MRGGWSSTWSGFRGKGGVWATEWDQWTQPKEEEEEINFGNQSAAEDEPQYEDDLGAVDIDNDFDVNIDLNFKDDSFSRIKPQHIYHINPPRRVAGRERPGKEAYLSTNVESRCLTSLTSAKELSAYVTITKVSKRQLTTSSPISSTPSRPKTQYHLRIKPRPRGI